MTPIVLYLRHAHFLVYRQALACPKSCLKDGGVPKSPCSCNWQPWCPSAGTFSNIDVGSYRGCCVAGDGRLERYRLNAEKCLTLAQTFTNVENKRNLKAAKALGLDGPLIHATARRRGECPLVTKSVGLPPPFQSEQFCSVTVIDAAYTENLASVRAAQKTATYRSLRFPQLAA
jgi:hypothetical protein